MYREVFIGELAEAQEKKILILGESHYGDVSGTDSVVRRYLQDYSLNFGGERDRAYRFFDYIVRTFGVDPEAGRNAFWEKLYFGNYVEIPCGVRDNKAKIAIKNNSNIYNESLFEFIKEKEIDFVFCFSRSVYWALPETEAQDYHNVSDSDDSHRLEYCIYKGGKRSSVSVCLDKDVVFYGLRHTSQGYSYKKYQERVSRIMEKHGISFE